MEISALPRRLRKGRGLSTLFKPRVSMVKSALGKKTRTVDAGRIVNAIKTGKYRQLIAAIRNLYNETLSAKSCDHAEAKRAVSALKKNLPGIMWSGVFTGRGDESLLVYSGLLCADLDDVDSEAQAAVLKKAKMDPFIFAGLRSPTGTGVKLVFRVAGGAQEHFQNFLAVKNHVAGTYGLPVDEACKNLERLCFVSDDPEAFSNASAKPLSATSANSAALAVTTILKTETPVLSPEQVCVRRVAAKNVLGEIHWKTDVEGFCRCPDAQAHTSETKPDHTRVMLDRVPTVSCFHNSCRDAIAEINLKLREEIRGAEMLGRLAKRLAERRFDIQSKPVDEEPRYFIGSTPVCTVGNITNISAGVKAGKSSVLAAMMAATMATNPDLADCLGFKSRNARGRAIIHLDTEQSRSDHYTLVERAVLRSRLAEPPPWLMSYCVTGFTVAELVSSLRLLLVEGREKFGGIHSAFIDGIADLVQDVNDPLACNVLVTELHALAIKFTCPIISAIHFNPGTEKTRGHLGSQLERKAETNLRLDKIDGAMVVWSEKNRRAPISKNEGPRFVWSEEHQMHVSVETLGKIRAEDRRRELARQAKAVFSHAKSVAMRWREIVSGLQVVEKPLSESGARKRIDKMVEDGILTKTNNGQYHLCEETSRSE